MVFRKTLRLGMAVFLSLLVMLSTSCSQFLTVGVSSTGSSTVSISETGSELQIYIIDVGNADSILVKNGEKSLLIDAGENGDGDDVVNFLRRHGIDSLDYAVATHPDADHVGGMDVVIDEIPVGRFIMSIMPESITPTTRTYLDLLEALDRNDVDVTEAEPGDRYTLGGAEFTILGPIGEFNSTNNISVVCRVDYGKCRFLFMGDAEKQAENAFIQNGTDLRADFIKLGHHGSRSSSQDIFLKTVNPVYAAISCGVSNRYGHPHAETLQVLKKMNITYYRTDLNGTIRVISDGSNIAITTEKE